MMYEAVAFVISDGAGVKLIGRNDLLIWSSQPYVYILLASILPVLFVLLNHTQFGYNTKSLQSGQKVAVEVGINEKRNAVLCYMIAGSLLAAAGAIKMSILGTMSPELGLSSTSYIQNAFLPMFLGTGLAKFCDRNVGVIVGALTQSIIISAMGKLGFPSSLQTVLQGVLVLCFFAYSFNKYKIVEWQMFQKKKEKAEKQLVQ